MFAGNEIYTDLNKYISIPNSSGESVVQIRGPKVWRDCEARNGEVGDDNWRVISMDEVIMLLRG